MNNNDLKSITLHSNSIQRDITLESYQKDDKTIITFSSLRNYFESIKKEFGIVDSISERDIRLSAGGTVMYAATKINIKDNNGYNSDFLGEAIPRSLGNNIAQMYPSVTATNRAYSNAIISYLQLGSIYSDVQLDLDNKTDADEMNKLPESEKPENIIKVDEKKVQKKESNCNEIKPQEESENRVEAAGTISSVPSMNNIDLELPYNDTPAQDVSFQGTIEHNTDAQETEASNKPVENTENELPANTVDSVDTDTEDITENSTIGFGKYPDMTISELFAKANNNDAFALKLIELCKDGKLIKDNPRDNKIVKIIKAKATK